MTKKFKIVIEGELDNLNTTTLAELIDAVTEGAYGLKDAASCFESFEALTSLEYTVYV